MSKSLIISSILFFTILLAILIWGGITNWKFIAKSSSSTSLLIQNECNPTKGCNVCDACCKPYISADYCDKCVSEQCSRCIPNSQGKCSEGVCSNCCYSYLNDKASCEGCVKTQCIGCNNNGLFDPSTTTCSCYDDPVSCTNSKTPTICNQDPKCHWVNESCSAKYKWKGPNCQYSRYTTCNSHGNPDANGKCTCDNKFKGEHCEYSRANCNNRGNPTWDGKTQGCKCDFGWTGKNCNQPVNVKSLGLFRPSLGSNCGEVYICPMPGVSFSGPYKQIHGDGPNTGIDITNQQDHRFKDCIQITDGYLEGPTLQFNATYENTGKTETMIVNKNCCSPMPGCHEWCPVTIFSLGGNTNYETYTADGAGDHNYAGGAIIGMPL